MASYTLLFTSTPPLTSASSTPVVISPSGGGSATDLNLLIQPSASATDGVPFNVQPTLVVQNGLGLPVGGVSVTASVASGPGTLGGTVMRSSNLLSIVSFTDLSLSVAAGSYTLRFSAGALSATSNSITLAAASTVSPSLRAASVPGRGNRNRPTPVSVQCRDVAGGNMLVGGHTVVMTVTGKNSAGPVTLFDRGDGTYVGGYTPTHKGKDDVALTLDGAAIGGSPYTSNVH